MMQPLVNVLSRFREMPKKRLILLVVAGFILAQFFIFFVFLKLPVIGDSEHTDTPVYFRYANQILRGSIPYHDFIPEYPPVAMLTFLIARLISGSNPDAYMHWFEVEVTLFSCGIVTLLASIAWRKWRSIKRMAEVLAVYSIFLCLLGPSVETRFDIVVGLLILASVWAFVSGRDYLAWTLLGVGLMTKIVPVLLAPLYLISYLRKRDYRKLWRGPAVLSATALIIALSFLVYSPTGLVHSLSYHARRPIQIESSWASAYFFFATVRHWSMVIVTSFGSNNLVTPFADLMAKASFPAAALLLIVAYYYFWRWESRFQPAASENNAISGSNTIIMFAAAVLAIFMFTGKVFSPQFLLWLIPLVPLMYGRFMLPIKILFGMILLLTQIEFPNNYSMLMQLHRSIWFDIGVRNASIALFVILLIYLSKPKPAEGTKPAKT